MSWLWIIIAAFVVGAAIMALSLGAIAKQADRRLKRAWEAERARSTDPPRLGLRSVPSPSEKEGDHDH